MKKTTLLFIVFFTSISIYAQNTLVEISGIIKDSTNREPLIGVSVAIKGSVTGTITDTEGKFVLRTKLAFPIVLQVVYIGYVPQEFVIENEKSNLIISLVAQNLITDEVVVSASRKEEEAQKSPVAIEKLDIRAIRETPSPSFYDALENVKGVQLTTSSLTFKVPNTRGFNIPNNFRFMQLADGVDMQAATLGVPLGNAIGPTELDIESVEITPGAASALYGMNAINGMANLQSKSPFRYQGLSLYQKIGINHVDGIDHNPAILTETSIRYARAFNNKFAFKINTSYMQGTDWVSNTLVDQNPQGLSTSNKDFPQLSGENNPAKDLWNVYGDENNNRQNISGILYQGKEQTFQVARTGYAERDLTELMVGNVKFDASAHYRVSERLEVSYAYRVGQMDGTFQRGNKIRLNDVTVQSHKVEFKNPRWYIRSYVNIENTGNSYNLKPLVDNLQLTQKDDATWASQFKTTLQSEINSGKELTEAFKLAREVADAGRLIPGSQEFKDLKQTIIGINNWDHASKVPGSPITGGALLRQRSRMYHTDAQYDLSNYTSKIADILIGFDARMYEVIPDGNNFVDFTRPLSERTIPNENGGFGNNIYYSKLGGFTQVTKRLLKEKLKLVGSLRYDKNLEFEGKWNPRIAVVYTMAKVHNFRISYQNGYRFPALFEALSFVNNGNVRRVGGLTRINEGLGYLENSYTLTSVNEFNAEVQRDITAGFSRNQAALRNRGLLEQTNLKPTQPEEIKSVEIGYKSILANNTVVVDWDAYYSQYTGFLGQVEVAVPTSGNVGSDAAVLDMLTRNNQTRYRVYTNAKQTYNNYGSAIRLSYNFYKKFSLSGNLNYNNISKNANPDVFVTGFNTPTWSYNVQFGNREILKNLGFNLVWRWQQSFFWESPLATGIVPAFGTIDAQVSYQVPKYKAHIKFGASNLLNKRYIQYAAGPTIGGLYYLTLTFDGLLSPKSE